MRSRRVFVRAGIVAVALLAAACGDDDVLPVEQAEREPVVTAPVEPVVPATPLTTTPVTTTPLTTTTEAPSAAAPRPDWLGTRVLEVGPKGYAAAQPTPPELVDRRLETPDHLPPPDGEEFFAEVSPVPGDVLGRSTWSDACPVASGDLRYVRLAFWGFDGDVHTGELLVHADAADAVVNGFAHLHGRRFPIEEMRVVSPADLDAPATGDGNNTTAFVCRPSRGSTSWSEHAYGRAVDVNPFHNPFVKGDAVLPELATVYVDRANHRPGMLTADDVEGFRAVGWGWGGQWSSFADWMHLSANGR